MYSGEMFDSVLQMQYLRSRYYDQNIGRFISRDRISGSLSDPQTLNAYNYVHSDPVNNIDPKGESLVSVLCGIAIGVTMLTTLFSYSSYSYKAELLNLSRAQSSISNAILQPKTRDTAMICVHGVSGRTAGWSAEWKTNTERFFKDRWDLYEYTWSGFEGHFGMIPKQSIHNVAVSKCLMLYEMVMDKGYKHSDVVAHSWGTTITHNVLRLSGHRVKNWVTMGSPLRHDAPKPANVIKWLNVYSPCDPVCYLNMYPPYRLTPNLGELLHPGGLFGSWLEQQNYVRGIFSNQNVHKHIRHVFGFGLIRGFKEHGQYWTEERVPYSLVEHIW